MNLYDVRRTDGRLEIGQTTAGRLVDATMRFVRWVPLAAGGLGLMFLPDYMCHYREQAAGGGAFWFTILLAALFIGVVGAFVKFSRRDTWVFDADEAQITFLARPLVGQPAEASIALSRWTGLFARPATLTRQSAIGVRLTDGREEEVCHSPIGWSMLQEPWEQIEAFIEDRQLDVDIEGTAE
jgi:hypothetical protein